MVAQDLGHKPYADNGYDVRIIDNEWGVKLTENVYAPIYYILMVKMEI